MNNNGYWSSWRPRWRNQEISPSNLTTNLSNRLLQSISFFLDAGSVSLIWLPEWQHSAQWMISKSARPFLYLLNEELIIPHSSTKFVAGITSLLFHLLYCRSPIRVIANSIFIIISEIFYQIFGRSISLFVPSISQQLLTF
jgi:hypothetical protein